MLRAEQQSLRDRVQRAESEPRKGAEIGGGKYIPTQTPVDITETAIMETPLSSNRHKTPVVPWEKTRMDWFGFKVSLCRGLGRNMSSYSRDRPLTRIEDLIPFLGEIA